MGALEATLEGQDLVRKLSRKCPLTLGCRVGHLMLTVSLRGNRSVGWSSRAVSELSQEKAVSNIWRYVQSLSSSCHDFGHRPHRRATLPPASR